MPNLPNLPNLLSRRLPLVLVFAFLPMIHGCATGRDEVASLPSPAPVALDLTPYKCPKLDQRYAREFKKTVAAPHVGMPVDDQVAKAKTDEFRLAEMRKNRIGQSLISDYEACRDGGETKPVG